MITITDGRFVAAASEPYGTALLASGWIQVGDVLFTTKIEEVIDHVAHLEPKLQELFQQTVGQMEAKPTLGANLDIDQYVPAGAPKLLEYQKESIAYCVNHKDTLVAEEAGLGKSCIALIVCNIQRAKRILIICPATVKYNWSEREWVKWSQLRHLTVGVAEGDDLPKTDVVIINYDILDRHKAALDKVVWDVLICDESHKLKGKDSRRTKMVLGGVTKGKKDSEKKWGGRPYGPGKWQLKPIPYSKRIFMTATPMNRPRDLWTTCQAMDRAGIGKNWQMFIQQYCAGYRGPFGWVDTGASNLHILGARMRGSFMIRHDPDKVIDLPPMTEEIVLLPQVQVLLAEEEKFVHDNMAALIGLSAAAGVPRPRTCAEFMLLIGTTLLEKASLIGRPEFQAVFTKFAILREMTGVAKLPSVIEYVRDKSDDGVIKTVVMAYHRSVVDGLREAFPNHAYIMGGMPAKKRMDMVDRFQNDESCPYFIGNMHAAGEGITLTKSNYLIFAEMDWNATTLQQARKRVHRITQDRPVRIDYLVSAKSFDAIVADKALAKMEYIRNTLDT